jgi:hypothetical protein
MKLKSTIIIGLSLCLITRATHAQPKYKAIHSGVVLFDQTNKPVNAHGANIVKEGDKYYLFGEYKTDSANVFNGFSCYSSSDLMSWTFEKMALPVQADGLLGPNRVGERVKVMKCPETGEFVMYMHTDDRKYKDPQISYASCKTINGDYQFHGALLYEGKPIKKWDMGTFQDYDGKGYLLIHHGTIYELAADYKSIKRMVTSKQPGGESPAMFKSKSVYYWLSSNLSSWERNDNYYLTSSSLEGPWTNKGLFAPKGTLTWNSQCSFVLPIISKTDTMFFFMGDRWSFPKQGSAASYVWQPIVVDKGEMSLPKFHESWNINFSAAKWNPAKTSKKSILAKATIKSGDWKFENDCYQAKEKGAAIEFPFKGSQIAVKALADSTCGYANVIIRNSKNVVMVNATVDFYFKHKISSHPFISPVLEKGKYTLSIEVLGEHGVWTDKSKKIFGSTDDYVKIEDVWVVK